MGIFAYVLKCVSPLPIVRMAYAIAQPLSPPSCCMNIQSGTQLHYILLERGCEMGCLANNFLSVTLAFSNSSSPMVVDAENSDRKSIKIETLCHAVLTRVTEHFTRINIIGKKFFPIKRTKRKFPLSKVEIPSTSSASRALLVPSYSQKGVEGQLPLPLA